MILGWWKRRQQRKRLRECIEDLRRLRHVFWTTGIHPPWYDDGECPWFGGKTLAKQARGWTCRDG